MIAPEQSLSVGLLVLFLFPATKLLFRLIVPLLRLTPPPSPTESLSPSLVLLAIVL